MWPWGHAAVGYTLYSVFSHLYCGKPPSDAAALVVIFGTQLPDFIDKPLAWTFGVLPTGRSLGHSLLTAVVILIIGQAIFQYVDQGELTVPFAVGHLSGIVTDLPFSVFSGDFSGATFLLWPYLASPVYPTEPSFIAHLRAMRLTPYFALQLGLGGLLILLWKYDGTPGVNLLEKLRGVLKGTV